MAEQIKDGTGTGNLAKVDGEKRLHTYAITLPEGEHANEEGNAYNINSKNISLSTDGTKAILYFKYSGTTEFHVQAVAIGISLPSSDGGDVMEVTFIRNPTSISNGSTADINSNRNYSSSKSLTGTATKGSNTSAFTGGDDHIFVYQNPKSRGIYSIDEHLGPDASIGIQINTNGSSGCNVYAAIIGYEQENNS